MRACYSGAAFATPVIPEAESGSTGIQTFVGGSTAGNVDLASEIASRLPLVIATVLLLLAVAVALAGSMVLLLAPALLLLFGRATWWLPQWLGRLLPRIDVEGQHLDVGKQPAVGPLTTAGTSDAGDGGGS